MRLLSIGLFFIILALVIILVENHDKKQQIERFNQTFVTNVVEYNKNYVTEHGKAWVLNAAIRHAAWQKEYGFDWFNKIYPAANQGITNTPIGLSWLALRKGTRQWLANPDNLLQTYQKHKEGLIKEIHKQNATTIFKSLLNKSDDPRDQAFMERRRKEGGDHLVRIWYYILVDLYSSL